MSPNKTAQSELKLKLLKSLRDLIVAKNQKGHTEETKRVKKLIDSIKSTNLSEKDSQIVFHLIYLIVTECPSLVKPPYDKLLHDIAKEIERKLNLNEELKATVKRQ